MKAFRVQSDLSKLAEIINGWSEGWLNKLGVSGSMLGYLTVALLFIIALAIMFILLNITRVILSGIFNRTAITTKLNIFKYFINNKLPLYLALAVPFAFIKGVIQIIFADFPSLVKFLITLTDIYMVFMVIWIFSAIIKSCFDLLREKESFKNKPMDSYIQVIQIVFFVFGAIVIYSIITGKSPTTFFAAAAASSAVLLLMFQDTIKGFVASIQISTNNMAQIGDWITMESYGADGFVEEVNLTTVKIKNFDNTVTTVPTYAMISESFQNWRGMFNVGSRRFDRQINIKQASIKYLNNDDLNRYREIQGIASFIDKKQEEFNVFNKSVNSDQKLPVNGMTLTNITLFMEYVRWIIHNHPEINTKEPLTMVRLLAPTTTGIPMQLYAFTKVTGVVAYEQVVGDIFSQVIAATKYFDISIYENLSESVQLTRTN